MEGAGKGGRKHHGAARGNTGELARCARSLPASTAFFHRWQATLSRSSKRADTLRTRERQQAAVVLAHLS